MYNMNPIRTNKSFFQKYLLPSLQGRGRGVGLLLLASLAILCACSDSNDSPAGNGSGEVTTPPAVNGQWSETGEEPVWQVDWQYNQTRPDWQEPEASLFENWTVITVEIEAGLKDMTSSSDLLAVLIDDEVCGLATPAITLGGDGSDESTDKYILKVYSNRSDEYQSATLKYYSDRLRQVFTSYGEISFSRYGDMTELVPSFLSGSEKYPLTSTFSLLLTATEESGVQPVAGDRMAAFVGDECRGGCTLGDALLTQPVSLQVYGQTLDETITLKYYHAATKRIFTFARTVSMAEGGQSVSLNF